MCVTNLNASLTDWAQNANFVIFELLFSGLVCKGHKPLNEGGIPCMCKLTTLVLVT